MNASRSQLRTQHSDPSTLDPVHLPCTRLTALGAHLLLRVVLRFRSTILIELTTTLAAELPGPKREACSLQEVSLHPTKVQRINHMASKLRVDLRCTGARASISTALSVQLRSLSSRQSSALQFVGGKFHAKLPYRPQEVYGKAVGGLWGIVEATQLLTTYLSCRQHQEETAANFGLMPISGTETFYHLHILGVR